MNKFKGILFTTDLDGTLLRKDKTISPENKKAIDYFMAEGGIFTFITGRIPLGAQPVLEQLVPNAPFGCINGGGIYDYSLKKMIWQEELDKSVLELVEYVDKNLPPMGIEVNTHEKIYFCKKSKATEKHRTDENFPDLCNHYTEVTEPFAKILFADKAENVELLDKMLKAHPRAAEFDFIRSDVEYYEILPKGASKGRLVKKLAEILNIDPKKTISAGDNDNDVSMLEATGISFAVSNASEKAKEAADYITVSNEEHAIAKILDDLDKGIIKI
ncbi:MAG: HAD family phosphatase [Clostridia bacterium]|nr:HAD family phosphatase [Clostridia bacterium]